MQFSCLSKLSADIPADQLQLLDSYFLTLKGYSSENITASKVATALKITSSQAVSILSKCAEHGIVSVTYGICCPHCSTLLKRYCAIGQIPETEYTCYSCDESFLIDAEDVVVLYQLQVKPDFTDGQQGLIQADNACDPVAQEDTLRAFLLSDCCYSLLYHPSEEEYKKLAQMLDEVSRKKPTTKQTGDTLESLTRYLFSLCEGFIAKPIRTRTNQIDGCVKNIVRQFGIFAQIKSHFIIECKNESSSPSGGYFLKIESIISDINAHNTIVGLGIIVSQRNGPKTFKTIATKKYLKSGLILINITLKEIKQLIVNRENLLVLLERKIFEVTSDATTDLKAAGLYDS